MSQNFQNTTSFDGGQPEHVNMQRFTTNRNVLDLATLTVGEMRDMSSLPPNQIGVLVSLFVAYAYCNTLSIFETVMMPLLAC